MDVIDLDNLASEIARKHLLENVSFRELGKMYYTSPSTIHRRLTKWLADGRFELQDKLGTKKAAFAISRDDSLGEALVRKTGIWRARVVRISGVEEAYTEHYLEKPDSQSAQAAYRASDELHRCLGVPPDQLVLVGGRFDHFSILHQRQRRPGVGLAVRFRDSWIAPHVIRIR